jgi:hypothetical protein
VTTVQGFPVDAQGRMSGPVAHHPLLENDDVKIWLVNTAPSDTSWHHYHHHDHVLFHATEMLGVVYNAEEDHDRIWRARLERGDHGAVGVNLGWGPRSLRHDGRVDGV